VMLVAVTTFACQDLECMGPKARLGFISPELEGGRRGQEDKNSSWLYF